jgi:hypothetical protein
MTVMVKKSQLLKKYDCRMHIGSQSLDQSCCWASIYYLNMLALIGSTGFFNGTSPSSPSHPHGTYVVFISASTIVTQHALTPFCLQMLLSIAKTTVGPARWRKLSHLTLTLSQDSDRVFQLRYPTVSLVIFPLALYPPVVYLFFPTIMERQYSVLMDIMGLSLSFMALSTIKIDSLMTGVVLLSGLFLYDIWWVFGSKPVFGTSVVSTLSPS